MSCGFIDESVYDDHGLYVVAVVIAAPALRDVVERALSQVVPGTGAPHWHDEQEAVRLKMARTVAQFDVEGWVYGCRFVRPARKEAARCRALGWMAQDLGEEVGSLILGGREATQDRNDRRVLQGLAGRPPRFRYEHIPARKEPMLWLPDIVVGAVACSLVGRTDAYQVALKDVLTVIECEP